VPVDIGQGQTSGRWTAARAREDGVVKKPQHSETKLVIVESPAKARTISKHLGAGYQVESSIGHIRDLPSTAAEIPPEIKSEPWARLGVNVNENFTPLYIVPRDKRAQVAKLKKALGSASVLYLATDEDREGEPIAWHLREVLRPKVPVRRMVFDEITRAAITNAVRHTRDIDERLVNAQEARRILDRLFGYEVSPVLWRKIGPKLSAGRVQSVATRLVVERERARIRFVRADYCDLEARLKSQKAASETLTARLVELDGRRVASGKDFDEASGRLKSGTDAVQIGEADARALADRLRAAVFAVSEVTEKPFTNRPPAPFITSTLQQEAGRKLRFGAQRTMRLAQSLYEDGYITYMRTDSTHLSTQALQAARGQITELYGKEYLPDAPRKYTRKVKNAQEAHEAIRPAGETFRVPKSLEGELDPDAFRLYELIWKRTVASQMKDATGMRTTVRVAADGGPCGQALFSTSGKVITFAGFLRAYVEGSDDPEAELGDQERILPPLRKGDRLDPLSVDPLSHSTVPPARFTEASLIQELEERGIGRPSTYASILQTIQDRGYVWRRGTALIPTFTAFAVVNLLERHLAALVDYDFTARMEADLDAIASGEREAVPWLHDFYFGEPNGNGGGEVDPADVGLKALIGSSVEDIDPRQVSQTVIGHTAGGEPVVVRVGRYGPYVQVGKMDLRTSIPPDLAPDELTVEKVLGLLDTAVKGDHQLGEDPQTGKPVYVKIGRFGPYVQLGDPELTAKGAGKKGSRPKMASLWPSMQVEEVTLEQALMVLSFPREVGTHPDSGEVITAQDGRYGPYLKMGSESRSLERHEQLVSVTLDEAVALFKQPKAGRRQAAATVAEIGKHPKTGAAIQVRNGRYGPYVTDGEVNATIPKGTNPAAVTLEQALKWIEEREQKAKDQGKDLRAKARKSAARSSRASAKKAAGSKTGSTGKAPKAKASEAKAPKATAKTQKAAAPKASAALGPPPAGYAWTRTGRPVVEDWPTGTLACPNCGSAMTLKTGRFGPFFACANYPACKTNVNLRGEAKKRAEAEAPPRPERARPIPTDVACTECGEKMVVRKGRGRPFLGCSAFPKCRATQPLPPELEAVAAGAE